MCPCWLISCLSAIARTWADEALLALGWDNESSVATVEAYDVRGGRWRFVAAMSEGCGIAPHACYCVIVAYAPSLSQFVRASCTCTLAASLLALNVVAIRVKAKGAH